MNDDFESRLAELLNESVDAQLGTTRVAVPPFSMPSDSTVARESDERAARRRRRFTFFAVAATVIAIVAAALALNAFAPSGTHRAPSVTQPPAPTVKGLRLGNAAIVLPKGWVARPYTEYVPTNEDTNYGKNNTWCLTPRSTPAGTAADACPVQFASLPAGLQLDPDNQGGFEGDPEYCFQGSHEASNDETGALRDFGGRPAVFYRIDITCTKADEPATHSAQYEVLGGPAYILYASNATPAIRSAMRFIAPRSTLPKQTSTLWRADLGRVVAVVHTGSTVHVTLRRVHLTYRGSAPLPAPAQDRTVEYIVPSKMFRRGAIYGPVTTGSVVSILTNGSAVTGFIEQYATK